METSALENNKKRKEKSNNTSNIFPQPVSPDIPLGSLALYYVIERAVNNFSNLHSSFGQFFSSNLGQSLIVKKSALMSMAKRNIWALLKSNTNINLKS